METCTVETGLLRKAACGGAAVAKCANCEQPLCTKHAIPQLSATGKKTGAFLCAECEKARKQHEKLAARAPTAPRAAPTAAKPAAAQAAANPAAASKPASPAAPAAARPPAPAAKSEPGKPSENSDGSIDFK